MNYLGKKRAELEDTVYELNTFLANYQIYYQNLRNFHWNIDGQHFFDLHEKFENLYNKAKTNIDEIAERILTLRFVPLSTYADYINEAKIKEAGKIDGTRDMVQTILENHQILIQNMRRIIKTAGKAEDEGTIDLIGAMLRDAEKESWMLDSWAAKEMAPA